ncbi:adenylyltransferase/cytidyltransferase family protein [Halomonas sp. MCCC 1A11036]|uniref:Adenylyltransferase/cytidyltransferase family protein n=1 Tax=Billgrantia zhangzhouensis TaxID=2733481 RepID=A0ABS9ADV7_9GAMM|nr:adenylyltransferase/cytidyltransferase family protein [Halomonas zhangzhouensis]MCE8019895.1 adenylyltransferase/cytidyltransferase family protein [Halomonas zhangzhouensis]
MVVGYTGGVFDLFHVGHLNVLRRAKDECDYLIVGVTTDNVSMAVKGKSPIIPFRERLEIVNSIQYVDEVFPQEIIDELGDWEKLKFNKIFKGSDWQGSEKWLYLEKEFLYRGVEVKYFPYTVHTSSTLLKSVLERLVENQGV